MFVVLFAVEADHELGGVDHCFLAVPLKEFLDCACVFGEEGEAGERHFAVHVVACFYELEQVEEALCAEEAFFGASAAEHCVPERVEESESEEDVAVGEGDVGVFQVGDEYVDSVLLSE